MTVSDANPAQGLYRKHGYCDTGIPPMRIHGTIIIRTGPIEVDDTMLTWEKRLGSGPKSRTRMTAAKRS